MTVPTVATYSAASLIAAHTELLTLIDFDASAAKIVIRDASDVLLATFTLTDPAGAVNGTTGQLALTPAVAQVNATTGGTAAYAEVTDGADVVHLSVPVAQGVAASTTSFVLNTLTIVSGEPITLLASTIG